jgi:acetolactate synthase-1/3 small subunit
MLKPYGLRELVQSGVVALGRGSRSLSDRAKIEKTRPAAMRLAN